MPRVTDLAPDVAARALLGALVDHAPLFPPAALGIAEALAEDDRARACDEAWMLGRSCARPRAWTSCSRGPTRLRC